MNVFTNICKEILNTVDEKERMERVRAYEKKYELEIL
tara:strand:- start:337 stop:447 length:111 start_codon:yes stop_codon:yes gene_type:complete